MSGKKLLQTPPLARVVEEEPFEFFSAAIDREAREVRKPGDIDVIEYIELYRVKTGATISDSTAIKWLNAMQDVQRIERCYDPRMKRNKTVWRPIKIKFAPMEE
jgi:hypothetical protein